MNIENLLLQEKINRGIKYFEENKLNKATEIFENLRLNKNTKNISYLFLGIISIKKKENTKAKKYFNKILENNPNHQMKIFRTCHLRKSILVISNVE